MAELEIKIEKGVQVIRFNRPTKKNAINEEIYKGIILALEQSAQDERVVLTVLTGNGDYYSSGNDFDVSKISDMETFIPKAVTIIQQFVAAFIDYPKLLVALVNGPAIGIACTTLALCDVVFASDKAWFRTPFTKLGLVPEGCSSVTFPRIMGSAKASSLLYLNGTMSASEALACGFVTQVYPAADLVTRTNAQILEYAQLPPGSLKTTKQLLRNWDREFLHRVNQTEVQALGERFLSEEFFNAMLSFRKQRSKL